MTQENKSEQPQQDKKYLGWLFAVKLFGYHPCGIWPRNTMLDPDGWYSYYEEGFSAMEAIIEDLKYI